MPHNLNRTRLILLALLILTSPSVFALGLGNIKVESYLNEPLLARVDLLVRAGEDISEVTAKLASAEDYALIGANRGAISVPLRFTVDTQTDQPFVRITSNLPLKEPVVRLILELNWASGRLLREYTVFLDPPTVPSVSAPPAVLDQRRQPPPPAAEPESPELPASPEAPDSASDSDSAEEEITPAAVEPDSQTNASFASESGISEGEYGPVQSGDTLWRIASNWADGSDASVNQVMLAIQRNNPHAFIHNNINLLKRGAILRLPDAAEISAISAAAAREEVQEQAQEFAAESGSQAAQPADSAADSAVNSAPGAQTVATAVETPLVDVASEMSSTSHPDSPVEDSAHLEIVPPSEESSIDSAYGAKDTEEGSTASTSAAALQEELARKEEALITEQQTNEFLQRRIKELEAQIQPTDLVVEDEELASMESRLREQRQAEEAAVEVETEKDPAPSDVPHVTTSSEQTELPWYQRWITWVIGLLVVVAVALGWYRSRRGDLAPEGAVAAPDHAAVRGIKDDAEEVLKVLEPADQPAPPSARGSDKDADRDDSPDDVQETDATLKAAPRSGQSRHFDHEEAHILDEESADPEVRLDLARAYISMGDREAARAILGEVLEHGDEAQKAEAEKMLSGL